MRKPRARTTTGAKKQAQHQAQVPGRLVGCASIATLAWTTRGSLGARPQLILDVRDAMNGALSLEFIPQLFGMTWNAEMGFTTVHLVDAGQTLLFDDLEMDFFRPDYVAMDNTDEWDVLQYFVHCPDGSFYSGVDCETTPATHAALKQRVPRVSVWCYTNNAMDWGMLNGGKALDEGLTMTASPRTARTVVRRFSWRDPEKRKCSARVR